MKKLLTLTIAFVGTIAVVGIIAAGCSFSPTYHDVEATPLFMEGRREANRSVGVRGSLATDGYSSGMRYLSTAGVPLAESAAPAADAIGRERFAEFKENDFREVKTNPLSTFGLDVDTASYTTMRDSVRIEEYVNYFSYDYAGPTGNVPVAVACELGACPWNAAHKLLRVAVQAKRIPKESIPPCNLVFLIDKSGSMSYNGGFTTLMQALRLLTDQLRAEDSVAIVSYASGVQVELPATSGADKAKIRGVLDKLRAGGGTSGGEGLQLAYEQAMKNFGKKKNNRVVLVTDGDFNIGINNPSELERYIATKRNYKDAMMKKLANAGNGNYAFLDSVLEAKKVLMTEFGGTMLTVAKDVKLQLEFNPAQVGAYRLLGYENRRLAAKDFNDDKKDAGEMGSGHSMTAFYELVPVGSTSTVANIDPLKYQKQTPVGSAELLTVKLRYKLPDADTSTRMDLPVTAAAITPNTPSESFRFASAVVELALLLEDSPSAVVELALLLEDSPHKGSASYESLIARARAARGRDEDGWRAEFVRLAETAQLLMSSKQSSTDYQHNP